MTVVRAKKNLGQHFLTDLNIARKIVGSLTAGSTKVLEIGPGMGVLTQYLFQSESFETIALDIDRESIDFLKNKFPQFANPHPQPWVVGAWLRDRRPDGRVRHQRPLQPQGQPHQRDQQAVRRCAVPRSLHSWRRSFVPDHCQHEVLTPSERPKKTVHPGRFFIGYIHMTSNAINSYL